MAEHLGRLNKIKLDGVTSICFRTLGEDMTASLIDITDSCSSGFSTSLDEAGEKMVSYSIEGMVKDNDLRIKMASGNVKYVAAQVEYWDGAKLDGDLVLSVVSFASAYNEAETFTATLQTSGAFVFTPAAP